MYLNQIIFDTESIDLNKNYEFTQIYMNFLISISCTHAMLVHAGLTLFTVFPCPSFRTGTQYCAFGGGALCSILTGIIGGATILLNGLFLYTFV